MNALTVAMEKWRNHWLIVCGRFRAKLIAFRGAHVGAKSYLGSGCRVNRPWCVKLGKRFYAEELNYLKVVADDALLEFGEFVFVGRGTEFNVLERVTIGDHTVIAPGCFITDHNHGMAPDKRIDEQPCVSEPVTIGKDVWLGTKVVILPGVNIGDGAVVAASAVVTKNVPPFGVMAGIPAKLLYFRSEHDRTVATR
jgi:acetyltransferase-like isoleucine patch superfamily enzyme